MNHELTDQRTMMASDMMTRQDRLWRSALIVVHFGDLVPSVAMAHLLMPLPDDFAIVIVANDNSPRPQSLPGRMAWLPQKNIGYFGGLMTGVHSVDAQTYWVLNNDLVSSPSIAMSDMIVRTTELLEQNRQVGIIAPALEQMSTRLERTRVGDSFPAFVRRPSTTNVTLPSSLTAVDWVVGACFAMTSEVAREAVDASYFLGGEDIDISYRTWARGLAVTVAPDLKVAHAFSSTIGPTNWWYLGPRAIAKFLRTHHRWWNLSYYVINQSVLAVLDTVVSVVPSRRLSRKRTLLRFRGLRDGIVERPMLPLSEVHNAIRGR